MTLWRKQCYRVGKQGSGFEGLRVEGQMEVLSGVKAEHLHLTVGCG